MDWRKYIIGEVLDRTTGKRSKKFEHIVGMECFIPVLEDGLSMVVKCKDGNVLRTTPVEDICECEYGIWVTTRNIDYRFDDVLMLDGWNELKEC